MIFLVELILEGFVVVIFFGVSKGLGLQFSARGRFVISSSFKGQGSFSTFPMKPKHYKILMKIVATSP